MKSIRLEMHKLKFDYIGSLGKTPSRNPMSRNLGPFDNDFECISSQIKSYVPTDVKKYILSLIDIDTPIVMSHGDFTPLNIIVDEKYKIICIIDWENGGSAPIYTDSYDILTKTFSLPESRIMLNEANLAFNPSISRERYLEKRNKILSKIKNALN